MARINEDLFGYIVTSIEARLAEMSAHFTLDKADLTVARACTREELNVYQTVDQILILRSYRERLGHEISVDLKKRQPIIDMKTYRAERDKKLRAAWKQRLAENIADLKDRNLTAPAK